MRPLCLRGHERPITRVLYNDEGDLLFTSSKDYIVSVWYSTNGERLGTYDMVKGAVMDIDVSWDTKHLVGGSAGYLCIMWDVETGRELKVWKVNDVVKACAFSYCGNLVSYCTGGVIGNQPSQVTVIDIRTPDHCWSQSSPTPITQCHWGTLDKTIITAHKEGGLCTWDVQSQQLQDKFKPHFDEITDLQTDKDMMCLLTSSKDHTAKLLDIESLDVLKTYKTERPVNSGCISPVKDHVILGGGQEAHTVTTTAVAAGKFDSYIFHMIYEDEIGRIKGHFGPVNTVAFHPEGIGFASGGEDGMVMLYEFDEEYIEGVENSKT